MSTAQLSLSLSELEHYAELLDTTVLQDANNPTFILHKKMQDWCYQHTYTVVLSNGDVLVSNPSSSELNHCQQYMSLSGIQLNKIYVTTDAVINYIKNKSIQEKNNKENTISDSHLQLRALIYSAINSGASDIHLVIMPSQEQTIVKFRVNGYLKIYARWTHEVGIKIHSVAYNYLSTNKQDAFSMILPQDMSFTEKFDNGLRVRIRSSNIGIKNGGCKVVYRLLSIGNEDTPDIEELGYTDSQVQLLKDIRYISNGLVLFCGETGSGKTTSLASVLSRMDSSLSVYSVEDPVEKYIDNVDQCPVDTRIEKKNFAHYLRALLRADPDVIMVGEIRDSETAEVAVQAGLTGHLILSTIHTKHAINAVMRLNDLGVSASHIASPGLLRMIVAQRLYPTICPDCARNLTSEEKSILKNQYTKEEKITLKTVTYNPSCDRCKGSGASGRRVFAEIINIDQKSREFIFNLDIHGWEQHLLSNGFVTMNERVKNSIISGEIDVFSLKASEPIEVESYDYHNFEAREI